MLALLKNSTTNRFDWPLLILGLIILLQVNSNQYWDWTQGFDYSIYDSHIQNFSQPADDKILIIEIDEQSLSLLGDWPWPRSYHAQMINLLTQADAGVIAYNIIFSNSNPEDINDQLLSGAIESSGRTILPLYFDRLLKEDDVSEVLPALAFRKYSGLGHVNTYLDEDGTLRSIRLMDRFKEQRWPHFSFASFLFNQPYSPLLELNLDDVFIPFITKGDFQRVSFVDVLTGLVPAETFSQRTVFVGMTATSMGDPLLIPTNDGGRQTPAVEINANVYQALDNGQLISPLPNLLSLIINTVFVLVALYLMPKLSGIQQFAVTLVCILLAWLLSYGLLYQGYWYRSAGLIIALLTIPFIWNLLRLSRLFNYLRQQVNQLKRQQDTEAFRLPNYHGLDTEDDLNAFLRLMQIDDYQILSFDSDLSEQATLSAYDSVDTITKKLKLLLNSEEKILLLNFKEFTSLERHKLNILKQLLLQKQRDELKVIHQSQSSNDVFTQQLSLISGFQQQLSMTHSLFEESIEGVSAGILVSDLTGKVLFSNKALSELIKIDVFDTDLLFQSITLIKGEWLGLLRDAVLLQSSVTVEAKIGQKDLSVSIRCIQDKVDASLSPLAPLLVFNITDISTVKQAHRSRSEMIDFLSHDLRSPMASLQALVNQLRNRKSASLDVEDLIDKVDQYSRRGLDFSEQFLELAKVESDEEVLLYEVDLYSVAQNAFDTLYHQAQEKSIQLEIDIDGDYWVLTNGELLERILLNLVSNAIKYSPNDSRVLLKVRVLKNTLLQVGVGDEGPGIPDELSSRLFKPYSRGKDSNTKKAQGIGLGLRFVDVALKRLNSQIQFETSADGTLFYFNLESIDLV
ncbi:MAG: CHASE2 domain-containing protein [Oleispira antarctica]|nr:CHASE2 domain-containing protein [Oleispira antarctica]MBQ0794111.1 CHASE2 domain-containing protein [Oleispira antarctica]